MQYAYCIASLFLDVKYSKLEEFRSSFWMDNGKTEISCRRRNFICLCAISLNIYNTLNAKEIASSAAYHGLTLFLSC